MTPDEEGHRGHRRGCGTGLGGLPCGTRHGRPLSTVFQALGGAVQRSCAETHSPGAGQPAMSSVGSAAFRDSTRQLAALILMRKMHNGPHEEASCLAHRHLLGTPFPKRTIESKHRPRTGRSLVTARPPCLVQLPGCSGSAGSPRGHSLLRNLETKQEFPRAFLGTDGSGNVPQSKTEPLPGSLPSSHPGQPTHPIGVIVGCSREPSFWAGVGGPVP